MELLLFIAINLIIFLFNILLIIIFILFRVGLICLLIILNIHGFIVGLILMPIKVVPTLLYKQPQEKITSPQLRAILPRSDWNIGIPDYQNLSRAKILIIIWRFVIPPMLGIFWFLVLNWFLNIFLSDILSAGLAITSSGLAVLSYFRLHYEFPLKHPNTFIFLRAESEMRFKSQTIGIERKVRVQRWWHKSTK